MVVWSVEYRRKNTLDPRRKWFATEREADEWTHSDAVFSGDLVDVYGPSKHIIIGKIGLVSFLGEYA